MRLRGLLLILCTLALACGGSEQPSPLELWSHHYLLPLDRRAAPPEAGADTLALTVTPGEFEPAVAAARADRPTVVTVALAAGESAGHPLPAEWCTLRRVTARTDSTALNRLLELEGPDSLAAGETAYYWLTVRPPEDAAPGSYAGELRLESGGLIRSLPVRCEVLPFHLEESPIRAGAFMCLIDLPPGWYRDMKEHGVDAIQFFTWEWAVRDQSELSPYDQELDRSPIGVRNIDARLELEFDGMDRIMSEIGAAGMRGPVVVSLGNDNHLFYEVRLAQEFGLRVDTVEAKDRPIIGPAVSPELDDLFLTGLKKLRAHWDQQGYSQELVILIYDEPTERLLDRSRNRYRLIKQALPDTPVYGVTMDELREAEMLLDQSDILVCNGDFDKIAALAREQGKGLYTYGSMGSTAHARWLIGALPWKVGSQGAFFWMYDYWFYDFDGCAVYPHPQDWKRLVSSPQWEAIREGADDLRYFATAEALIARAGGAEQEAALARLAELREAIPLDQERPPSAGASADEVRAYYLATQQLREQVIGIIRSLPAPQ